MVSGGDSQAAAAPIDHATFGRQMAAFAPFERNPRIAVAVSGGADSLCLALLTQHWASDIGGEAVGLIVDHGLRTDTGREAHGVSEQLRSFGMTAHVLRWTGDKPGRNIQARARDARYALLLAWCRAHDVIHLAVGHHAADQAETHLLRRRAGSGPTGLAGMAALSERRGVRVLRPLLTTAPERLRATVAAEGLSWVDDPSNRDLRYTRTKLRQEIGDAGTVDALCTETKRYAKMRAETDHRIAAALASSVIMFPAGYVILDIRKFDSVPLEDGNQSLARIISGIGAVDYPPRSAQLESLRRTMVANDLKSGRTLGGCMIMPIDRHSVLICREPKMATEIVQLKPGEERSWDKRFRVRIESTERPDTPYTVGRLDDVAWGILRRRWPEEAKRLTDVPWSHSLPAPARASLPVLCDLDGPCALPHLPNQSRKPQKTDTRLQISFRPRRSLAGASFALDSG